MKTFTPAQKTLMAQLDINLTSDEQIDSFYEGWEESSFECRANGIPSMSFDMYLEQKVIWNNFVNNLNK